MSLATRRFKFSAPLRMEISLPSIAEQRRIVARIEELAAKIKEARGLREGAIEEFGFLFSSELSKFIKQEVERSCELREIGEFTIFDCYGPRFHNESYSSHGIPIMRAPDIHESGEVDYRFMPSSIEIILTAFQRHISFSLGLVVHLLLIMFDIAYRLQSSKMSWEEEEQSLKMLMLQNIAMRR